MPSDAELSAAWIADEYVYRYSSTGIDPDGVEWFPIGESSGELVVRRLDTGETKALPPSKDWWPLDWIVRLPDGRAAVRRP